LLSVFIASAVKGFRAEMLLVGCRHVKQEKETLVCGVGKGNGTGVSLTNRLNSMALVRERTIPIERQSDEIRKGKVHLVPEKLN
jgi:hypothetical protein